MKKSNDEYGSESHSEEKAETRSAMRGKGKSAFFPKEKHHANLSTYYCGHKDYVQDADMQRDPVSDDSDVEALFDKANKTRRKLSDGG
jgi:hypothetical protein